MAVGRCRRAGPSFLLHRDQPPRPSPHAREPRCRPGACRAQVPAPGRGAGRGARTGTRGAVAHPPAASEDAAGSEVGHGGCGAGDAPSREQASTLFEHSWRFDAHYRRPAIAEPTAPSVRQARVLGAAPPASLRARRRPHGREPRPRVSSPQRAPRRAGLWAGRDRPSPAPGRAVGTSGAESTAPRALKRVGAGACAEPGGRQQLRWPLFVRLGGSSPPMHRIAPPPACPARRAGSGRPSAPGGDTARPA
jgi:hypothetical protein